MTSFVGLNMKAAQRIVEREKLFYGWAKGETKGVVYKTQREGKRLYQ